MNIDFENYEDTTQWIINEAGLKELYRAKIDLTQEIAKIHKQIRLVGQEDDGESEEWTELQGEKNLAYALLGVCESRIEDIRKGYYIFKVVAKKVLSKEEFGRVINAIND